MSQHHNITSKSSYNIFFNIIIADNWVKQQYHFIAIHSKFSSALFFTMIAFNILFTECWHNDNFVLQHHSPQ